MPRSGPNGTYTLPGAQATQQPGTPIPSAVNNQGWSDAEQTFNTIQPRAYGGTDSSDLKLNDANFGVRNNADATKIGVFNAAGLPTATTRTYDLPYYSGTLGLVSDIRGQIFGLTLSNNVTDATNDIDIAVGSAVENGGVVSMVLASGLTKQLDVAWAVGNNAGMRASGAAIANTTYHIFLIRRPDTGVVDIAADTSATGANIAANTNAAYTQIRRIGSIIRKSAAILAFSQMGDTFLFSTPQADVNVADLTTSASAYTLTTPVGIKTVAIVTGIVFHGSSDASVYLSSLDQADLAPNPVGPFTVSTIGTTFNASYAAQLRTALTSQIRARSTTSSTVLRINTQGYIDTRGQYA